MRSKRLARHGLHHRAVFSTAGLPLTKSLSPKTTRALMRRCNDTLLVAFSRVATRNAFSTHRLRRVHAHLAHAERWPSMLLISLKMFPDPKRMPGSSITQSWNIFHSLAACLSLMQALVLTAMTRLFHFLQPCHHLLFGDKMINPLQMPQQAPHITAPLVQYLVRISRLPKRYYPGWPIYSGIHRLAGD